MPDKIEVIYGENNPNNKLEFIKTDKGWLVKDRQFKRWLNNSLDISSKTIEGGK